ncbi:MAG: metallophosphoesterase family protein [Polyangiaceae bacterium]
MRVARISGFGFLLFSACSSSSPSTNPLDASAPADASTGFAYAPAGCAYTFTPPDSDAFTDLALDGTDTLTDVASSAPARVRIGVGGGTTAGKPGYADITTSAAFTWEATGVTHATKVKYGTDPNNLSNVQAGYSWTTPGGIGAPVNMHEAHVCGLTPGTTYYYQVGGPASGGDSYSATQSFTTAPASGAITVGVSGDSRDSSTVFQLVQERMRDAAVAFQIMSGDLIPIGTEGSLYQQFLDSAWKDPADSTKFLTLGQQIFLMVPGNHENDSSQYFGNFALPGLDQNAERFGSINIGNAHIVLLDDETIAADPTNPIAAAETAWLEQDLTAADADRTNHPFEIVVHHRGELSTSVHATDADVVQMRKTLMPIWDKHHVDLVLNGHDHNYERSKAVTGPATAPVLAANGTTYVVCAGAGATAYAPGTAPSTTRAINVRFGDGTPYVGVYELVTLDANKISVKAYGLKNAGGGVAGDDVIDTFDLTH